MFIVFFIEENIFLSIQDIDNNGQLDQKDFECMAVRACVIEGKGECSPVKLGEYQHIMRSLWDEISDLADFDKVKSFHFFYFCFDCPSVHLFFPFFLFYYLFLMINYFRFDLFIFD